MCPASTFISYVSAEEGDLQPQQVSPRKGDIKWRLRWVGEVERSKKRSKLQDIKKVKVFFFFFVSLSPDLSHTLYLSRLYKFSSWCCVSYLKNKITITLIIEDYFKFLIQSS